MSNNQLEVRKFIIEQIEKHPSDIVKMVVNNFSISRQRANFYVSNEVKNGTLIRVGVTRNSRYFLLGGKHFEFISKITSTLSDDYIWMKYVKQMLKNCPSNVISACAYGFTEMFNNAIDHSQGNLIYTEINIENGIVNLNILDNGIGIFRKIQNALNLESEREAILHLSKGKFTTDPTKHTGEGIFFTSRIFDRFSIFSDDLYYAFENRDWMISPEKQEKIGKGTVIRMSLSLNPEIQVSDIFKKYADSDIGFFKTIVSVGLSADPGDPHVSRSQAKRLLLGLEKFRHVILDFKGVESVGQAFVDQVFRVFTNEYPNIKIQYVNANPEVELMIQRGLPEGENLKLE